MPKPRVYIETSIPSFYYTVREDPASVARRDWTRHWWDFKRIEYEACGSEAVLDELARATQPARSKMLRLFQELPLLEVTEAIVLIAEGYVRNRVMPADISGDALHLALASYYRCDFLLTWNCRHLANANKFRHIQRVNTTMGLFIPNMVTPLELIGEEADHEI